MQHNGLRDGQVSQVRGFADQRLRLPSKPEDPSNRRITLIVQYLVKDNTEVAPSGEVRNLAGPNVSPAF
jgi:chemotaxis protein MotB